MSLSPSLFLSVSFSLSLSPFLFISLCLSPSFSLYVSPLMSLSLLSLSLRLEEALGDCIWAQKHMRENAVIDYKQLGLRYKLYSWQVLYNAAAVHCRMDQWEKAGEILMAASQEKGARGAPMDQAMESISRREVIAPLFVPEGVVFRPRKQDVEALRPRDFLGKPEVIISNIPDDDFGGFEPLRPQKPGFYEPKVDEGQDSRYMCVKSAYMGKGPGELTVPPPELRFSSSAKTTVKAWPRSSTTDSEACFPASCWNRRQKRPKARRRKTACPVGSHCRPV
uniref:NADPH oxidase activator 1 n=1 Tax=Astyanax mexicanus TaxID=7994 RepID=A0A3B1K2W9_ASTMX